MKNDKLAWLKYYPGDFMRVTRGWPLVAKGALHELNDAQMDLGVLPVDPGELQTIVGATDAEWTVAWRKCEPLFPVVDGSRVNIELREQIVEAAQKRVSAVEKARHAAAVREANRERERQTALKDNHLGDHPQDRLGDHLGDDSVDKSHLGDIPSESASSISIRHQHQESGTRVIGRREEGIGEKGGNPGFHDAPSNAPSMKPAINGKPKEPEDTRERAERTRKAIATFADWGDAEIAKVARVSLEEVQQARRDLTQGLPSSVQLEQ